MRILIASLLLLGPRLGHGQLVLATGGGHAANGGTAISYTIGEPVIATAIGGSAVATQGFQQPWVDINTVVEDESVDGPSISVYPNPVRHVLHIAVGTPPDGQRYVLHDAAGRQVTDGRLSASVTDLDMEPFASGGYYLRVLDQNDNSVRSFKISVTH